MPTMQGYPHSIGWVRVGRDRARYLTTRLSIPPVATVRATFTAHGDRLPGPLPSFPFHPQPGFPGIQERNSTLTHLTSCGPLPCTRLSRAPTTMATLTLSRHIRGFRSCFQPATSALVRIVWRVSYGHNDGLNRTA